MITRAAELALLALAHFPEEGPGGPAVQLKDLASALRVRRPFLALVLQQLARTGLLRSKRGRTGGFLLGRPAAEITLADVVLALDGAESLHSLHPPLRGPAGTRLEPVRRKLIAILSHTTLQDLARRQPVAIVSSAERSSRSRA